MNIDLGGGVYARLVRAPSSTGRDDPVGFILDHPSETSPSGRCGGTVLWDRVGVGPGPVWRLVRLEPLEVTPSIRCHCGREGVVRHGRWQDVCDAA